MLLVTNSVTAKTGKFDQWIDFVVQCDLYDFCQKPGSVLKPFCKTSLKQICPIAVKLTCGHEERNPESSFQHSISESWQSSTIKWQRTADKYVQNNTQALSKSIRFDCLVYDHFQQSPINADTNSNTTVLRIQRSDHTQFKTTLGCHCFL